MKKYIIIISSLMMMGLIIALVIFQNSTELTQTKQLQPNEQEQPVQEQPLYADQPIDYSLERNQLHITFNKGKDWIKVPVEQDTLFGGEYNGNKNELIDQSYILTKNRIAFLVSKNLSNYGNQIVLTYSLDQGATWKDALISEEYPSVRFRKVVFLSDQFGYVILSGGRTMSQELSTVFLTNDGGESWKETKDSGVTRLIADGGFVDENTGFLSYGTINPESPDFHVTQDAGLTWDIATIHIPEKYQKIFVTAEVPFKEDDHLAVLINQGSNGDFEGGNIKGKFLSEDNGKSWEFSMEVNPDE